MDRQVPHLESDASLRVLLPILGLFGGLGLGALRLARAADIGAVALIVSGGIIGSHRHQHRAPLRLSRPPSQVSLPEVARVYGPRCALVLWFALTMLAAVFASGID